MCRCCHLHDDEREGGAERGGEPAEGLEVRGEGEEFGDAEPDERGDEVAPDECPGLRERGFDGAVAEYSGRALFLFKFFFLFSDIILRGNMFSSIWYFLKDRKV